VGGCGSERALLCCFFHSPCGAALCPTAATRSNRARRHRLLCEARDAGGDPRVHPMRRRSDGHQGEAGPTYCGRHAEHVLKYKEQWLGGLGYRPRGGTRTTIATPMREETIMRRRVLLKAAAASLAGLASPRIGRAERHKLVFVPTEDLSVLDPHFAGPRSRRITPISSSTRSTGWTRVGRPNLRWSRDIRSRRMGSPGP